MREKEATTARNETKSGDEQHLMPYGMSLGSEVNMANCVKHSHHFFNRYPSTSIDKEVVIAYWMMAGYLGPASDFDEAYAKGIDIWRLGPASECNHEGFCVLDNLAFFHLIDFIFDPTWCGEYFQDHNRYDNTNIQKMRLSEEPRIVYLVDYKATPESLKKMLAYDRHPNNPAEANNLNALLIRGCQFLSSIGIGILSQYSTYHFNSLTVVEISSSSCSCIDIGIISELTLLQCLNLSHLPDLEMLPHNLFYKLTHLRRLIVRGCCNLRSLPSIDGLTRLVVLDLSHCTSLKLPFSLVDIRYPHLQMLDLSYTPMIYMLRELSTPNLTHLFLRGSSSLKNLVILNKLDKLQVLDLSECENLLNLSPFMNVPSLKHLNLCGCTSFTNFHENLLIDQMSCLEDLDLSWTKVKHLPSLIRLSSLGKLSLRGVELDSLEAMAASLPSQLLHLDLTSIKDSSSHELKLDFLQSLEKLEILNLSGSSVEKLPDLCKLVSLKKLLLANCPQLKAVPNFSESVEILNLSKSSVEKLPDMSKFVSLKKLLLADCKQLKVVPDLNANRCLKELDLSGLQIRSMEDFNLDFLESLEVLNLSGSSVEKLPDMSKFVSLEKLMLADCEHLKVVPNLNANTRLMELDLSGLRIRSREDFNLDFLQSLYHLKILNLSGSSVEKLPDMSKLESLKKLLLADCPQLNVVSDLRYLHNLKTLDLSLPNDSSIESHQLEFVTQGQRFPLPVSLRRLVLTNRSGIHKLFPTKELDNLEFLDLRGTDVADCDSILRALKAKAAEIHVVYGAKIRPSEIDDFVDVAVPLDAFIPYVRKKLKSAMTTIHTEDQAVKMQLEMLDRDLMYIQANIEGHNWKSGDELLHELVDAAAAADLSTQAHLKQLRRLVVKLQLLVPPKDQNDSEAFQITKKIEKTKKKLPSSLFMDKLHGLVESIGIAEVGKDMPAGMVADLVTSYNSLSDIQKKCLLCFSIFLCDEDEKYKCGIEKSFFIISKKMLIYWWVGEGFINVPPHEDPNQSTETSAAGKDEVNEQVSATEGVKSIEEIGKQILNVLVDKEFIQPVIRKRRESASYWMHPSVYSFVIDQAKKVGFFDFDQKTCAPIPHFSRSQRACLLPPEDKFLEDLNKLKKLRLLSLQGLPTIIKLPDSVCQLSNLLILDLKECSYLEELPADIGSLKSLTHLDISNCHLFHKLPKGISLLSKLQVLRGFVFTEEHGARASDDRKNASILSRCRFLSRSRNDDVCTLRDLLKLKLLRELSVVVGNNMFLSDEEVQLFKEMKQLRKLKILWEAYLFNDSVIQCGGDDTQECKHLDNIEKLELWCFPHEEAPEWLNPTELRNLEKLYIVGGRLTKFRGLDTDDVENPWNVKTLRLKHLHNLDIEWDALKNMFPRLTYLEKHQCDQLAAFPCGCDGVWKSEN